MWKMRQTHAYSENVAGAESYDSSGYSYNRGIIPQ